ncbi:MAG TPA: carboxylesterase family protein [Rhizomicrobium sp.]|nr:carboxylesterase family protein [Rhizomicrobium sp.]
MSQESNGVSRRHLLTHGAVLACAGVALSATASQAAAAPDETPNLNPPVVQVRAGKLRGFRDGPTLTFLGVPYAQAERFGPPQPVTPWTDIKGAQTFGPVCPIPQATSVGVDDFVFPHRYWVENENCQVLNIWTQNLTPSVKKPVMVWMHGGGFTNGSAMESYAYEGKTLSEFGDVVVVSVNHRLNIIGTLDLSAYGAAYADSRNTGMADLVASLQWVHDNIETFGGDPGNVTIFGQSGGGGKVTRLMHMPAAQGLFHKVICQSSSLVDYRGTDPAKVIAEQQAVAAATLANLKLTGADIDKLKTIPYRDLLAAGTAALKTVGAQLGRTMGWDPVADDRNVMRELCDWAHAIPYIAGNVLSEFNSNLRQINDAKNDWSAAEVDRRLTAALGAKKDEAVAEFRKLQPRKKIQDILFTDNRFRRSTKIMLAQKLEKATAPVYSYLFDYEYPVNGGVTPFHTAEIAFAFHALSEPHIRIATGAAAAGLALQELVSTAWLNFARTGNPSQPALAWTPYSVAGRETMVFDVTSAMQPYNDDRLQALLQPATPPRRPT